MATTLSNGAHVLHEEPASGGGRIVLAERDHPYHPFVTWWVDPKGNAYIGHYHATIGEALTDYAERVNREAAR